MKLRKIITAAILAAAIACSSLTAMAAPVATNTAVSEASSKATSLDKPTLTAKKVKKKKQAGAGCVKFTKKAQGKVTYKKVSGAKYYAVYRKVEEGTYKLLRTTTNTYIVDKQVKNGTGYSYKVRCVDAKGNTLSKYSKALFFYRIEAPKLTLKDANFDTTYCRVRLTRNAKVDGYEIEWSPSYKWTDTKTKDVDAFKTDTKSVKITGLKKGEAYFIKALAYIKDGKTVYFSVPTKTILSQVLD